MGNGLYLILGNIVVVISILLQIAMKLDGKKEECFDRGMGILYLLVACIDTGVIIAGGFLAR